MAKPNRSTQVEEPETANPAGHVDAADEHEAAMWWPYRRSVSGLYVSKQPRWQIPFRYRPLVHEPAVGEVGTQAEHCPSTETEGASFDFWWFSQEELRLDVDRFTPQMAASGVLSTGLRGRVHWIASLSPKGPNAWLGKIWYKDGNTGVFPYTVVRIVVTSGWFGTPLRATATFTDGASAKRVRTFLFKSRYFHDVEFEYDCAEGTSAVTSVQTHAHPNRPASMRNETLSIAKAYQRTGFDVRQSGGGDVVPLLGAGANARWSDAEMHDAMQTYWSRFTNSAQWSMWVFFAALHEAGTGRGGVMFDDIGPNHRQGTSIFEDSFISNPPAGDSAPDAWVRRMRFWTACHEMGHAFNLAHSWQKDHPSGTPWIPLQKELEARSFMNYPYNVSNGQTAFFADFEYRFSDNELLFLRHAPARFVQMGNADWFDDHGFQQASVSPEPAFRLELRANRSVNVYEFMEPVVLELKLTNISGQPQLCKRHLLSATEHLTVIIKKENKAARQFTPYAQYLMQPDSVALEPGQSLYESLFVSVGTNGWDLAEPGRYMIQICLGIGDEDLVSNPLHLKVTLPEDRTEEVLAQDYFSDEVGRILTFDGSEFFAQGNRTLEEVCTRMSKRRVALHARIALLDKLARGYKRLVVDAHGVPVAPAAAHKGRFEVSKPRINDARATFEETVLSQRDTAAESLGHIDFRWYTERLSNSLADAGANAAAAEIQGMLHDTLAKRSVLQSVLDEIKAKQKELSKK